MFSVLKSAIVEPHPVTGMRRVIRHIFTIVTFERWTINWEKAPKDEDASQDGGSERYLVELKRKRPGHESSQGKAPVEEAGEQGE